MCQNGKDFEERVNVLRDPFRETNTQGSRPTNLLHQPYPSKLQSSQLTHPILPSQAPFFH